MPDPVGERRRRRRAAERRRRAARRRRNFLACAAAGAFVIGLVVGAGGAGETADQVQPAAAAEEADAVPTVEDFQGDVPILMYHAIQQAPAGHANPELFVPQAAFEEQMKWLADEGYNGVTLGQVFAAWEDGEPIARNPVVVSFDDGLRSQYEAGLPALERLGWPGVLNLKLEAVDQGELDEAMVEELIAAGWEINAHSLTHPDLTTLDAAALEEQVAGSREQIETRFGQPADFFCYPAGQFDAEVIAAVKEAGYLGATTTEPGLASPEEPFTMRRIRVLPADGPEELAVKLG